MNRHFENQGEFGYMDTGTLTYVTLEYPAKGLYRNNKKQTKTNKTKVK